MAAQDKKADPHPKKRQKPGTPAPAFSDDYLTFITDVMAQQKMPAADLKLSDAELRDIIANQQTILTPVSKSELLPIASYNPLLNEKDAGGKDIPIYDVFDVDTGTRSVPKAQRMETREGHPYILVNEAYHQWTPDYAALIDRKEGAFNAPDLQKIVDKGDLQDVQSLFDGLKKGGNADEAKLLERNFGALTGQMDDIAKNAGVDQVRVLIDTTPDNQWAGFGFPSSYKTDDGENVVFVGKEYFLKALSSKATSEELLTNFGHEVAHIARGDYGAEGESRRHDPANGREAEMLADLDGAGPLGTHNPDSMVRFLTYLTQTRVPDYLKANPDSDIARSHPDGKGLSDTDLKSVADWWEKEKPDHPSAWDRIAVMNDEKKRMQEYEQGHTVSSPDDKRIEAGIVIAQVQREMRDMIRLDPDDPANRKPAAARGTGGPQAVPTLPKAMLAGDGQGVGVSAPSAPLGGASADRSADLKRH